MADSYRRRLAACLPALCIVAAACTSFEVRDFDALPDGLLVTAPAIFDSRAYAGRRAATIRGPAGELIELIEAAGEP